MFVGFIAVIVILLIIVGVMSNSMGEGSSNGVTSAQVTNMKSEISNLAQNLSFYKIDNGGDYTGMTVSSLVTKGILDTANTFLVADATVNAIRLNVPVHGDYEYSCETGVVEDGHYSVIKSKAIDGVFYNITTSSDGKTFYISPLGVHTTGDYAVPDFIPINAAIETSVYKVGALSDDIANAGGVDGTARIGFK